MRKTNKSPKLIQLHVIVTKAQHTAIARRAKKQKTTISALVRSLAKP